MISNMFQSISGNNGQNNNNNNNNENGQMPSFDLSQMENLFVNMGGLFGNQNNNNSNNNGISDNRENFSNIGINDNNDENVDYKEKYKEQLAQMKDMGFVNEETNIQDLKQCSGNVQFAVERLLNMFG